MGLADAMTALEDILTDTLLGWSPYQGVPLKVVAPAVIIGLPDATQLHVNAKGHARYSIPITFAVPTVSAMDLVDVIDSQGEVMRALDTATNPAWLGEAVVTDVSELRLADNAGASVFALDLVVSLIA